MRRFLFSVLVLFGNLVFLKSSADEVFKGKVIPLDSEVKKEMMRTGIYQEGCPLPLDRLREVKFSHYDFSGKINHDGSLVVMDVVSESVKNIMEDLFNIKFPIEKSRKLEFYSGSDDLSMADNNSSSFNCRSITGKSGVYSIHSYGLAMDINPVQNPYLGSFNTETGQLSILPSSGLCFLNRANVRMGMVENVVWIFEKHGFVEWGGRWNDRIDWQHFQVSKEAAELLASMNPSDGKSFFNFYSLNHQSLEGLDKKSVLNRFQLWYDHRK